MKKLNRNEIIAVTVSLVVVVLFVFLSFQFLIAEAIFNQGSQSQTMTIDASTLDNNELIIQDIIVGSGEEAVDGKKVSVHYTGQLTDGTIFDSSVSRNEPLSFIVGAKQVIDGWDQGVLGMKVGGKRVLVIPPSFGYGEIAIGPIPANSTLIFEIDLLEIK